MHQLVPELVSNPRRLRIASIKGAVVGIYHPDPTATTTATLYGFQTSGTVFVSTDEVVILSIRINHSTPALTVAVETSDGSGDDIVVCGLAAGGGGQTEVKGHFYCPGGFRVATSAASALSIVYAVLR